MFQSRRSRFVASRRLGALSRSSRRSANARHCRFESLEDRALLAADFLPDRLLIQFKPDADPGAEESVRGLVASTAAHHIHSPAQDFASDGLLEEVDLPPGLSVDEAIQRLEHNPAVAYAEPDYWIQPAAVSNDPYYTNGSLWGMYGDTTTPANQYGSQAGKAWAAGNVGSSSVVVGIVDEGIDYNHPDLAANIWTNPGEVAGDGIDNDADGYIDDVHGWDFANNNRTVFDGTPTDSVDAHGTHVAGTIGAVGGNGQGVAGVNWNVKMISAKFLGPNGGSTSGAVLALDYLTMLKTKYGVNIVASNNSWGGGGFSQSLQDAITRGAKAGILFVAAAGNGGADGIGDNNDTTANYPSNYSTTATAGYESVIGVAAIDSTGKLASFSNYGASTVDLGAPGVNVYSTLPFNSYGSYSGTSMATPHVTGAVALYAATHPTATAADIRSAIISSAQATPTTSLAGKTATGGRLNISALPDVAPSLRINDVSLNEGNSGTTAFTFIVSLSAPSTKTVTVAYAAANGTATAGSDYTAASGTLTFAPGVTSQPVTVLVTGDTTVENNETFFVNLSNASGASIADSQGQATIVNDDVSVTPAISINNVSKMEGNKGSSTLTFTVTLSAASTKTITVAYATANGTATAASDYKAASGTLSFSPGVVSKTIAITIIGDTAVEANDTFFINLSNPVNATLATLQGVGTILNDDGAATAKVAGGPGDSELDDQSVDLLLATLDDGSLDDLLPPWANGRG